MAKESRGPAMDGGAKPLIVKPREDDKEAQKELDERKKLNKKFREEINKE